METIRTHITRCKPNEGETFIHFASMVTEYQIMHNENVLVEWSDDCIFYWPKGKTFYELLAAYKFRTGNLPLNAATDNIGEAMCTICGEHRVIEPSEDGITGAVAIDKDNGYAVFLCRHCSLALQTAYYRYCKKPEDVR